MNLNLTFPNYRSLSPAEVTWAENFESATGWKLVGTNAVKDSASFWQMALVNKRKFDNWASLVQNTIELPENKSKLPPKKQIAADPVAPNTPVAPEKLPDSSPEKTEQ